MSAARAENELASKAKAASPVPKNFKFIVSSPIRMPWIVTASTRRRSHRAQTHALTWIHLDRATSAIRVDLRSPERGHCGYATTQRAISRTIRWITVASARENRGNHPQNHANHLTLAAQYPCDGGTQALHTAPLPAAAQFVA